MRHFPTLASLTALLLASCEPSADSSLHGGPSPQEQTGNAGLKLGGNTATLPQLAAQDSVGKPPQPRNLIADVADTCPAHHEKMRVRVIPIVFEEAGPGESTPAGPETAAEFPFAAERIFSAGNALQPGEAQSARVYQCASCIAAKHAAWERKNQPTASE